MSSVPPVSGSGTALAEPVRDRAPDGETFWTRYSPHHEFPLSSVASLAAHVIVGVLFVAVFANFWFNQPKEALPLDVVAVPGGGGDPKGDDQARDHRNTKPGKLKENVAQAGDTKPDQGPKQPSEDLHLPDATRVLPDFKVNGRPVALPPSKFQAFDDLGKHARRALAESLRVSKGKDGPGIGGGKGGGEGLGNGDGSGVGNPTINVRMQRVLRWTMKFDTFDGDDYRKQLAGLGAILALDDGRGGHLIIRDLDRVPARTEPGDLSSLHRIFWIDNNPKSVASLAGALEIRTPRQFIAFFPVKLEKELLAKELEFRGRAENDIKETVFEIRRTDDGNYVPVVVAQKAK